MSEPNPDGNVTEAIKEALFAGNKIEAIKLYRGHTKLGLAESKAAVEQLEVELRKSYPERFATTPKQGCTVKLLALTAIVAALWRALGR